MLQPLLWHSAEIRVRYADTDKMQVVYNGKYFEYFEVGRTELLRSLGLPYAELEQSGVRLPVIEAHCRFIAPALYDDLLVIETSMPDRPKARLRLEYRIFEKHTSTLIAEGYTDHAFIDVSTGKPRRPPDVFLKAMPTEPKA